MSDGIRKKYDSAFKERAIKLMEEGRKASHLSKELGIPATYLYRWKKESKQYEQGARFAGNGNARLTDEQKRIKELERQLADALLEQEILKNRNACRAIGIFSQRDRSATGS